ncbi:MAG: hypothetical protein COA60_002235 [Robiginitomaculum sp.]|nr:hypothetical protein [Robiginitomaculum sp.]
MRLFLLLLFIFLGFSPSIKAEEPPIIDPALTAAHAELLEDAKYQFEFSKPQEPRKPFKGFKWLSDFLNFSGEFFKWVFWVGLAALVAGIAWLILREILKIRFGDKKKSQKEKPEIQIYQPEAIRAKTLLEEADKLAAQGKFSEAVHLLLFRSIEDIEKFLPGHIKTSQTSREIEVISSIPEHPKSGFERLRKAVENSFFGQQPVDKSGYDDCRLAYEDFAFSASWRS